MYVEPTEHLPYQRHPHLHERLHIATTLEFQCVADILDLNNIVRHTRRFGLLHAAQTEIDRREAIQRRVPEHPEHWRRHSTKVGLRIEIQDLALPKSVGGIGGQGCIERRVYGAVPSCAVITSRSRPQLLVSCA